MTAAVSCDLRGSGLVGSIMMSLLPHYYISNSLADNILYIHSLTLPTRDGMIQAPRVSMHHVKSIMIW